jgi:aminobenzoyl-glutamate utilization protein B
MKCKLKILIFLVIIITFSNYLYSKTMDDYKTSVSNFINRNSEEFINISRSIWSYAELGFQEYKSSELMIKTLKKYGFKVQKNISNIPTAFIAEWGEGSPVIGVTGEFDALPGLSQKAGAVTKEPMLENAPGHGCGHNILGTTGLLTAITLKTVMEQNKLKGTIKFFGTPAEESGSAKVYMVRDGFMNGVDVVLDNHPGDKFAVEYGFHTNALFYFKVTFLGKAAHAASNPWDGVSALDAFELMAHGINLLREHLFLSHRIHYIIEEGGVAPNIVPDKVVVAIYVRDSDDKIKNTYEKVLNCVKAGALATGCNYKVELINALHQVHINENLAKLMYKNMKKVGIPSWSNDELEMAHELQKNFGVSQLGLADKVELIPPPDTFIGGYSTDLGEISLVAPTATITVPTWPKGIPLHSWASCAMAPTSIAHKGMIAAAKALAYTGIDLINKPEILKEIKDEFENMKKIYPYKCYLPDDNKPSLDLYKKEMERFRPQMKKFYMDKNL